MEGGIDTEEREEAVLTRDDLKICDGCSGRYPDAHKCSGENCECPTCHETEPDSLKRFRLDFLSS